MSSYTETTSAKGQEPWSKKAQRHGVVPRTLDRWAKKGVIKKPMKIRGRKYGPAGEEPRLDPDK